MREIKFRFWSKILNYFVVPDDDIFVGALKDEYMIVMQYTGFKDKTGKEIYEEDLIKLLFGKEKTGRIVAVKWGDNGYHPRAIARRKSRVEVIGNIYENPELLKQI